MLSGNLIQNGFFSTYKSFLSLRNIISAFSKFSFEIFQFQNLNYNLEDSDQQFQDRQYVQEFLISSKKEQKQLNLLIVNSRKWTTKYSYCNFNKLVNNLFKLVVITNIQIIKALKFHENFLWYDEEIL